MSDFDFHKPYGSDWKRKVGVAVATVVNSLVLLAHTMLFLSAISVLWGWYFVGVVSCLLLMAWTYDSRRHLKQVALGRVYSKRGERIAVIYCLALVAIAFVVNTAFVVLYSFGQYRPPFGDVPTRYR